MFHVELQEVITGMAAINRYSWLDPHTQPPNFRREAEGDSHEVSDLYFCSNGQKAIKIFDGSSQTGYSCYLPGSLTITRLATPTYDRVNNACVLSTRYNTPGVYASLEQCESASGPTNCQAPKICVPSDYCPPGMVCLPFGEFSQIEGLAATLNNSACS